MALPALGDQALVEPICRRGEDQALVDPHDGSAHRSRLWWSGFHHPHLVLASGLALLFLGDGLLKCYPRHRRRRFLHAWAQCPSADILCGHPLHVLSSGHHLRPRRSGDDRWQPSGGLPWCHLLFLVADVLSRHGPLSRIVDLALRIVAPSHRGRTAQGCLGGQHHEREPEHLCHLLPEAPVAGGRAVHAALPNARGTAGQGVVAVSRGFTLGGRTHPRNTDSCRARWA